MHVHSAGGRAAAALLASMAFAAPSGAVDVTVTNQAEFEAEVTSATQTGQPDTINVEIENTSSGPALMLPGVASPLTINFNGVSGGPAVYNPTFDVGFGVLNQALGIGAGTTLNFNTDNGIASLRVGFANAGVAGTGTVNMTGGTINGIFTAPDLYFSLNVGRGSPGSLGTFNQSGGEIFINSGAFNVGRGGATGVFTMSGNALLDMGAGTVYLGTDSGGNGTLYIHDNAQFLLNDDSPPAGNGQVFVGVDGGTGLVVQDGAGSRVVLNAQNGTHFGLGGGTGEYRISAGVLEVGGLPGNAGLQLGASVGGTGIFTQTGGVVELNTGTIRFGVGTGAYNLNGGTLQIDVANPFLTLGGAYAFNLGGGTIQAMTNFSTALDFDLSGVSTINTFDGATANTVTLSGAMDGSGALVKEGAGTLIFNGAKAYTGGTEIAAGTLRLGTGGSLAATGALQIDTLGTFDLNGQDQTVGSLSGDGTVLVGTGDFTAGGNNASTTFSGTVSMTNQGYQSPYGTFAKVGTGTLTIDNATFELGETYIRGGKMAQTSGEIASYATGDSSKKSTPFMRCV